MKPNFGCFVNLLNLKKKNKSKKFVFEEMLKGIELIWVQLGRKSSQIFGNDCACAAIWMFLILWIRLLVGLLKLNSYIPYGEMFASPLFLSVRIHLF